MIEWFEYALIDFWVNDKMADNPDYTYWDIEPDKCQLIGVSETEYQSMPDEIQDNIFPPLVTKITACGWTVASFCKLAGLDEHQFMDTIIGKRQFIQYEIVVIRTVLHLSDDEIMQIFFPEFVGRVVDIRTGKQIVK